MGRDDVIKAIEYAQDNGAKICCMAFSTYVYSEELENAIRSSDMLFVVPSENDGFELVNAIVPCFALFVRSRIINVLKGYPKCEKDSKKRI